MNTLKCMQCRFYDPIKSAKRPNASHGWCAVKSIYPFKEGPGQQFPSGVRRVDSPEKPAKPMIVRGDEVVTPCTEVRSK